MTTIVTTGIDSDCRTKPIRWLVAVKEFISLDYLTVPTASFKVLFVLFVLFILSNDRRRILHFNVTDHPTAAWTAQQLVEACGMDEKPKYLIRDRDAIYGKIFSRRAQTLGIEEVLTAYRSPWQNPYAERVIGSIRRECHRFVARRKPSETRTNSDGDHWPIRLHRVPLRVTQPIE